MDTAALARELLDSYENAAPLDAALSTRYPEFDLQSAYVVEAEFRRLRGRTVTGRKVGYANKAMWRVLKLDTLVWAAMYDDTVHDGAGSLAIGGFMSARLEPEIVFKLKQPLSGENDAAAALAAVEWMALGYEIIDCPFPGWQFKPVDFVAAWGLHRALVIGEHHTVSSPDDLASFKIRLSKNGELVDEGGGKNSLKSPALCLSELARASGGLQQGELISTGTLTNAQSMTTGDHWRAEVEGLPLPSLELRIS